MSQLSRHPAYLMIADQLDAVGQKYRVQQLVRGLLIWGTAAIVTSLVAALIAHKTGESSATRLVLFAWIASIIGTAIWWVVRPLLLRPGAVEVARLVENRVPGLHNGLTNTLLLVGRSDLQSNPWLPDIFDEILTVSRDKPIGQAVKWSDLRPMGLKLLYVAGPALLIALLFPTPFVHGWTQMFSPGSFVPQVGKSTIVDVKPGDVTLIAGQALEVTVIARDPSNSNAKLLFEGNKLPPAEMVPVPEAAPTTEAASTTEPAEVVGASRYTCRVEHIDNTIRYRIEVGDSQSPWFTATVVKDVKLTDLTLKIAPPAYTKQPAKTVALKADELTTKPVTVPQGSQVELIASVDVPVAGGMLQVADAPPAAMAVGEAGQRFSGSMIVTDDTPVAVLLTQASGQVIARLPEQTFTIHCAKDTPPLIKMKWPTQDSSVAPSAEIKIQASISDDLGLASSQILVCLGSDAPLAPVDTQTYADFPTTKELSYVVKLPDNFRKHGNDIRVQLTATDNRDLNSVMKDTGPQTTPSPVYVIHLRDPEQIAKEEKEKADALRAKLMEMLRVQQALNSQTVAFKPTDADAMTKIGTGQSALRADMQNTAQTFPFDEDNKMVQKTLLVLAYGPAKEAVDLAGAVDTEPVPAEAKKLVNQLGSKQRRIIDTLQSLLAMLAMAPEPTTQPTTRPGGDLVSKADAFKKLDEALKQYMKEQQKLLDQAAGLAKKPVDNFDDKDKKLLNDLMQAQDKLDTFMQEKISDFSKNAEQDMANASMIKDAVAIYSEVTMAKDGLKQQAMEIAVPAEEMGLEDAKELSSNIEKWLSNSPDRQQWSQEDPMSKTDTPMPELPKELDDMVGELMEQQEDLFQQMEDANANYTDSMDKGVGWDAADGPIADMSAKGVTGNQLPNDNEMAGRSGEGRSGRSQGEFVGDNAQGKGGRNTPTRLDPTPFAKGQINDTSKDPVGGATGGGKLSGQGGAGLEGPVPPKMKQEMERLKTKQAELRNAAERLNLKYQLGRYDNFKLEESITMMRRVESDIDANRYVNALRRRDVLLDTMDTSHLLLSGKISVERDTTPAGDHKMQTQINDAMKGDLPAAWSDALKEYYKKLAEE